MLNFPTATLTGGFRRKFEILRLAKQCQMNLVIVIDHLSYTNASKMFPDFKQTLNTYKVFLKANAPCPRAFGLNKFCSGQSIWKLALFTAKVASKENADLIVGDETVENLLTCYIASQLSFKPWTAVFQPTTDLLQPSPTIGPLTPLNIMHFINQKQSMQHNSQFSKAKKALKLLLQLKLAQKTLMLSVSHSVQEEIRPLNPKIHFVTIRPGNGLYLENYQEPVDVLLRYDALFFGRLVPIKGLYALPHIWKQVVNKVPNAKLAVAGIIENQDYLDQFFRLIDELSLRSNIVFLGPQNEKVLVETMKQSKLTLNPTTLDSFSLVTLESLASGTPVVTHDIAAIRYNFGACEAVLRCPLNDYAALAEKTISVITNENFRKRLSTLAMQYVSNYTWANVVQAEKAAYLKVASTCKPKH